MDVQVQVYDAAIPASLAADLRTEIPGIARDHPVAMWVPRACLDAWAVGKPQQLHGIAEHVVGYVYERLMKSRLPRSCVGAEWWCQSRSGD
eukprot:COSAG05_NODE_3293_length_2172_cov_1.928606_1_plen_90_part_10